MKKVSLVSLGCSKNLVDAEEMMGILDEAGFELVADEEDAEIMIVNTCAFIQSAKEESIETILDLAYLKEHHDLKAIIVTGCLKSLLIILSLCCNSSLEMI